MCPGSDAGVGDLAHVAFPDTEKLSKSIALSAYLGNHTVRAVIDENNLYQGMCRLKELAIISQ